MKRWESGSVDPLTDWSRRAIDSIVHDIFVIIIIIIVIVL